MVDVAALLRELGIEEGASGAHDGRSFVKTTGETFTSIAPRDGAPIASTRECDAKAYEKILTGAEAAFAKWRAWPAPKRGDVVREIGEALRAKKDALGTLVSLEMGKILSEGKGEVQEMIDIADFAVGLSRQLYGATMHSERKNHRMYEQWHPLGIVGIVTAFNFPVAVWSWNAMIAAVCGDVMVWKPSEVTPLTAIAVQRLIEPIVAKHDLAGVFNMIQGRGIGIGSKLVDDRRVALVSATGSCRMGRQIGQAVAARLGRTLLELGGNNALLVMEDADLDLVLRAVLFGAVGTAGQRCTTTRRLLVHERVYDKLVPKLVKAYGSVRIGDPLEAGTLMGPLVHEGAVDGMMDALKKAKAQGGKLLTGGKRLKGKGFYVEPTIVEAHAGMKIWREETFAPILYVFKVKDLDEAIALNNGVDQGLSSALFTLDLRRAERFLSAAGSDCGIANVNIGTSGAEIGGAFGGEKDTGGGREAGSDSWKAYMRRQTNTINWGAELPLAQGVQFDL
ncbi:MAG: aldehyde dehydrogenase family protein [Planctomycetes bacterium]|nr:aldehyde dehydrogenase family protein [Planctomycetota bacterium]